MSDGMRAYLKWKYGLPIHGSPTFERTFTDGWDAGHAAGLAEAAAKVNDVAETIYRQNLKHQWYGCNCQDVLFELARELSPEPPKGEERT